MTPSAMRMSAPSAPAAASEGRSCSPDSHASREHPGQPVAIEWYPGSMKSGPTFADATRSPRAERAAIKPVATVVLPTPEWVPETTTRGPRIGMASYCHAPGAVLYGRGCRSTAWHGEERKRCPPRDVPMHQPFFGHAASLPDHLWGS